MKRRGMTLIELCVAVALTGILLSLTLMSLRQPINKAGPKVVAEQTAEFLRRARNRAQTENCPVAVVFSTNSGAAMCCQSVAEISGELHPRVHRLKDFSAENPDTVLFVGKYGASGTWSKDPPLAGASGSFVDDIVGLPGTARIIEWVAGETNPMLIFLPDGTASSNDLPHLDGAFRIVVSQGVSASASSVGGTGSLPNPPVANLLSEVCNPYTVSVEATGDVRVETGLIQGDGSTAVATSPLPLDNVAPPMLVDPRTSVAPEITDYYDVDASSKNDQLKKKLQQSEKLLQNILPPVISRRLKNGETCIADDHKSVTVVFAALMGFDEYSINMGAREIVMFLNDLIVSFV